jgi:hypothetical protein
MLDNARDCDAAAPMRTEITHHAWRARSREQRTQDVAPKIVMRPKIRPTVVGKPGGFAL